MSPYYPELKSSCYHFVIRVDNSDSCTVDNTQVVCEYYSVLDLKLQYVFQNLHAIFSKSVVNLLLFREQSIII